MIGFAIKTTFTLPESIHNQPFKQKVPNCSKKAFLKEIISNSKMESRPKLFIHIGTPKTGTTSIQNFLASNQKSLYKNGFFFQKRGLFDNSYINFLRLFYQKQMILSHNDIEKRIYRFIADDNFNDATRNIDYYEDKIIKKIHREIFSKRGNIILSSESFFDHDISRFKEKISLLKKITEPFKEKYDIKIIVYFRKQDSYIESFYYMCGKYTFFSVDFESYLSQFRPFSDKEDALSLDWSKFTAVIEEMLPYAGIISRSFDQAIKKGIVADFREITGTENIECASSDFHDNPGFNIFGMDLMLNSGFLNFDDKEILFRAVRSDALFSKSTVKQGYRLLSPSQRVEIYNTYKESNRNLFGINDEEEYYKLFFPSVNNEKPGYISISNHYRETIIKKIVSLKKKTMEYKCIRFRRMTLDRIPPGPRSEIVRRFLPLWQAIIEIYWKFSLK